MPIEVSPPEAGHILPSMFAGFFGLILLILGSAAGLWPAAAAGLALLCGALFLGWYLKRCFFLVDTDQIVSVTPFSRTCIPYREADLLILRRSWTRLRGRTPAGQGLINVAARLMRGKKALVTLPASWREGKGFREAMAFLASLPIPKQYL